MRWMEMLREGGEWLGAARNWIKWNVPGGDRIKWGSEEVLTKNFRMRDIEELAAQVASAAESEALKKNERERALLRQAMNCVYNARQEPSQWIRAQSALEDLLFQYDALKRT